MADEASRKVFVGGLPWQADDNVLRAYFQQFGGVETTRIIMDKGTGNSKGYGFVIFADPHSAQRAVMNPFPVIEGKKCNCNLASLGAKSDNNQGLDRGQKRNFQQSGNWSATAAQDKRRKYDEPESHSYVTQLRQQGQIVTPESVLARLEELATDPCEAYKYFIERAEVFEPGSSQYQTLSADLLHAARTVRVQQALADGITTGLVIAHGAAQKSA